VSSRQFHNGKIVAAFPQRFAKVQYRTNNPAAASWAWRRGTIYPARTWFH
jgi:hypothetical protein